jgi:hypothetical protein
MYYKGPQFGFRAKIYKVSKGLAESIHDCNSSVHDDNGSDTCEEATLRPCKTAYPMEAWIFQIYSRANYENAVEI